MTARFKPIRLVLAAALALIPLPGGLGAGTAAAPSNPPLGLMGTIPIYWGEARQLDDLIGGAAIRHWARAELERGYQLRPVDYLDATALDQLEFLLLAQPRALSGEENVALDAWVRAGGHLLLFADPMMTGHSDFSIGDRRRPQDVALLSPILEHWGLDLEFVEDQPAGPQVARDGDLSLPVNLPGRFVVRSGEAQCLLSAGGVLARCAIGQGWATIVADAAVLDLHQPDSQARPALDRLAEIAFGASGEIAGR